MRADPSPCTHDAWRTDLHSLRQQWRKRRQPAQQQAYDLLCACARSRRACCVCCRRGQGGASTCCSSSACIAGTAYISPRRVAHTVPSGEHRERRRPIAFTWLALSSFFCDRRCDRLCDSPAVNPTVNPGGRGSQRSRASREPLVESCRQHTCSSDSPCDRSEHQHANRAIVIGGER